MADTDLKASDTHFALAAWARVDWSTGEFHYYSPPPPHWALYLATASSLLQSYQRSQVRGNVGRSEAVPGLKYAVLWLVYPIVTAVGWAVSSKQAKPKTAGGVKPKAGLYPGSTLAVPKALLYCIAFTWISLTHLGPVWTCGLVPRASPGRIWALQLAYACVNAPVRILNAVAVCHSLVVCGFGCACCTSLWLHVTAGRPHLAKEKGESCVVHSPCQKKRRGLRRPFFTPSLCTPEPPQDTVRVSPLHLTPASTSSLRRRKRGSRN